MYDPIVLEENPKIVYQLTEINLFKNKKQKNNKNNNKKISKDSNQLIRKMLP